MLPLTVDTRHLCVDGCRQSQRHLAVDRRELSAARPYRASHRRVDRSVHGRRSSRTGRWIMLTEPLTVVPVASPCRAFCVDRARSPVCPTKADAGRHLHGEVDTCVVVFTVVASASAGPGIRSPGRRQARDRWRRSSRLPNAGRSRSAPLTRCFCSLLFSPR